MKHKYKARVTQIPGDIEEVIFDRLGGAPSIPARYFRDKKEHGKFKHGNSYSLDPEAVEGEIEEEAAEQQAEAAREQADALAAPEQRSDPPPKPVKTPATKKVEKARK